MMAGADSDQGDSCLLLLVELCGAEPPPDGQVVAEKETAQGRVLLSRRLGTRLAVRFEGLVRLEALSCPLSAEPGYLCVAEVRWRLPDLIELCVDGILVASSDRSEELPPCLVVGGQAPFDLGGL